MTPSIDHIRVRDCAHHGILSCSPTALMSEVAGVMAKHRVHAVAICDHPGGHPVGVVSDLDVAAAAASGGELSASQSAVTEPLAVSGDEPLRRAAELMAEHRVAHLIVLDAASGQPIGVLSTLDIAAVYAGSRS